MLVLTNSVFWALFPIIVILTYSKLSPLLSLAWSSLFAGLFFAVLMTLRNRWAEILNISALKDILWVTFFIALLYHGFLFLGLNHTSAGNASIVQLTEVFFSFVFFNLWKKEVISAKYITGAILMIVGAVIILFKDFSGQLQTGDFLIFIGTACAPIGNLFQQRARKKVSSETIMFGRSILAAAVLFIFCYFAGYNISPASIKPALWFLLINGILIMGLNKILWIEALHRISVTKSVALSSIGPLFTLIFVYLIFKQRPTAIQLLSFIPLFFGVILLTRSNKLNPEINV